MRQYRFFVEPDRIKGKRLALSGEQARQITSVLRMREAEQIIVLDNSGWQYEVRLDKVSSGMVTGEIVARGVSTGEPQVRITLYQALLRKDNFEWVLQKGTELGVTRFVPLITQHSVVRQMSIKPAKLRRWQRIIGEAAEQSGRGRLPELSTPLAFSQVLEHISEYDQSFIPWVQEKAKNLVDALGGVDGGQRTLPKRVALIIGPEGGFADEEIESAREAGVEPVTLGPRILRAETAAIIAATLALSTLGELA